jgi:class 3 adenylate cyclase
VNCSSCGTTNDPEFRFCSNCGSALDRVCSNCATTNRPDFNFCSSCGTALEAGPAGGGEAVGAPDPQDDGGERRFVSVLFADLVGFTALSEARDPEELRAMLTRYFELAKQVVARFGGEVDKFIGDAVTAFWGARVALEDDAERAVRAALELVAAVADLGKELDIPELALRAGVLSGETSVGAGGNEIGLVVGDIVNTASRLQSMAEPNSVYVGESTRALAAASVRYEQVGELDMKGKTLPVAAWRAAEIVSERGGRGRVEGLEPPFVGREYELRLLKDQLHATIDEGRARLVSLIGEGGIGKSRLAWELMKYVDGLADVVYWHHGRSPAYGDGVTFWALGEMVRQRARIAETDDPHRAATKLRTAVAEFVADPEANDWIGRRVAGLLGLEVMPEGDQAELFSAWRSFFQHVAEQGPVVLVFEDLHWADEGLLDFIVELVERSSGHPILVVTLSRPALLDRYPGWGAARRGFTSAHLGPLADRDVAALVRGMAPGIHDETVDMVVAAAAGVPLYAVEYVRMLVAGGDLVDDGTGYRQTAPVDSLSVPDSLHAVVAARIDRLGSDERAVIQDAAVLGQSFTLDGLAALSGRSGDDLDRVVSQLVRGEILQYDDDPRSPERGQHKFVQSVIREVAYGRLSRSDRKRRHVAVAHHYEGDGAVEFAAIVADHYMKALEIEPDETLAAAARASMLAAAQRAFDLHSHRQALTLVRGGLDIPGEDAGRVPLWELGALAASNVGEGEAAVGMARDALGWHQAGGAGDGVVRAARILGYALMSLDRSTDALEAMGPHFVPGAANPEMRKLGAELARAHMLAGNSQASADVARDTMVAAEAAGDLEVVVETLNTRGTALLSLGRLHESLALLAGAIQLATEIGSPLAEVRALNNYAVSASAQGVVPPPEISQRFFEMTQRVGISDYEVRGVIWKAEELRFAGDFGEAVALFDSLELPRASTWGRLLGADAQTSRWALSADRGHLDQAMRDLDEIPTQQEPQIQTWTQGLRAVVTFLRDDPAATYTQVAGIDRRTLLPGSHAWELGVWSAIRLRDGSRLEAAAQAIDAQLGRRFIVMRQTAAAAVTALDGDVDAAGPMFVATIELCEKVDGLLSAMILRALFGELLPDSDLARIEAGRAHDWFTAKGAAGYLALFDHVWPEAASPAEAG